MRILVVEDSSVAARILKHMLTHQLECSIDVAPDLASAAALLAKHDYFVAICDLNLPDAPGGESVELVLGNQTPCIVLTGSLDAQQRRRLLQMGIVDYVYKENRYSYEYVVKLIATLARNRHTKVLVADDSALSRKFVRNLLELHLFEVIEAENGARALELLDAVSGIRLLIADYNMPGIDGFELILRAREKFSREEMAIIGLSNDTDETLTARFIKNGANDFLQKPFVHEEFHCRVSNTLESLEMVRQLWEQANLDYLTSVYNRRFFFNRFSQQVPVLGQQGASFSLAVLDIDFFKDVNDKHGHDVGDFVLTEFASRLKQSLGQHFTVARFGGEEFVVALKGLDGKRALALMEGFRERLAMEPFVFGELELRLTASIGIVALGHDSEETLDSLIKQADVALYQAKTNGRNRCVLAE
ncbi:response regulator [Shewanella amazonensis]|uniref:diguanylate cyclase n=1 Tax=Shewanella amazonensis (strain ATCC BAA-1098 / SB2B) TaxID=326297 RepID=A1S5R2_SHEAM|nr:response regulator [Shewanella amazonensis]ABL99718.1 response regulator receiver modulated diguanylate cyclase [Shewanella amazonensis SB2B]